MNKTKQLTAYDYARLIPEELKKANCLTCLVGMKDCQNCAFNEYLNDRSKSNERVVPNLNVGFGSAENQD